MTTKKKPVKKTTPETITVTISLDVAGKVRDAIDKYAQDTTHYDPEDYDETISLLKVAKDITQATNNAYFTESDY